MAEMSENLCARIFAQAIKEERAAELMNCLLDGGSATVDAETGKLVLATGEQLKEMIGYEAQIRILRR